MSSRQEIKTIVIRLYGNTISSEILMSEIDPIIANLIGEDDTEATVMPKNWNEALKKQYINFRNHMRRGMRAKYGHEYDDAEIAHLVSDRSAHIYQIK